MSDIALDRDPANRGRRPGRQASPRSETLLQGERRDATTGTPESAGSGIVEPAEARLLPVSAELVYGALEALIDPFSIVLAVRNATGQIVDHRICYSNQAALTWAGLTAGQVVGASSRDVYPALEAHGLFDAFDRVIETGEPLILTAFEYADVLPSGRTVRGVYDLQALKFGDGAVVTWRDVTDHEAGRRDRERLSAIVAESPDGILTTDYPELRITYVNAAFAEDLGCVPSELVGRPVLEVVGGVLDAATLKTLRKVGGSGKPWLGEADWLVSEGASRRVEIRATPRQAADGSLEGFLVVVRDVTQLRAVESERARLSVAVEQTADLIIVTGRGGIIEAVNPAFERLTGYPAASVVGRPSTMLRSGGDRPEVYASMDAAMRGGKVWAGRRTDRRADGSLLELDVSISPIRSATGELIGTVGIGRDRSRDREIEAEHERETQIRAVFAKGLGQLPPDASLEQAAQAICEALLALPFVDIAAIEAFSNGEGVEVLAVAGPPGHGLTPGDHLPASRAAVVRERSVGSPWAQFMTGESADVRETLVGDLKAVAYGPILRHGDAVGALVIGTFDEHAAQTLVEHMPGLVPFSATSSALLAERLHARRQEEGMREAIRATIADGAFYPVFQPIVDLETREAVGYEALTRFESGQRPDQCFADAWSVGLGAELELATLAAAVAKGKELPAGRWLDLNVSPRLLADPERLSEVLWAAERPLVLEITEHEEIGDYPAVRDAIRALGKDVRVAVDDAGAGVANFGHIIDLHPDFVKLDLGLVRRVNANMGRQALVVGMRHFSRSAGCRLVAEGVETEAEASTLDELGVEFGQGYLFGRPAPAEAWPTARSAAPEANQLTLPDLL